MKLSFLASAVVVIFAAAPEKSRAETIDLPEQYIAFFACADRIATEQVYAGLRERFAKYIPLTTRQAPLPFGRGIKAGRVSGLHGNKEKP